jgi:DNA-binding NarL/FixJ family response regulator
LEVVCIAHDGLELLKLLKKVTADLILMDISMPNLRGIEATHEIKVSYPDIKIMMLTMYKDKEYLYHSLAAGANGFLLKHDADTVLEIAIDAVRKGKTYISQQLSEDIGDDLRKMSKGQYPLAKDVLTIREKEILKLISEGKTSPEIAKMLYISSRTVEHHRANIMKKLNINNKADIIKYAIREGYTNLST